MGIDVLITILGVSGVIFFLHRIQREIGGLRAEMHNVLNITTDHESRIRDLEKLK